MKKFTNICLFYIFISIYIIVLFCLSPLFLIVILFIPDLKKDLIKRFIPAKFKNKKEILVHASSTGEALLAYNLFENKVNYTYFNTGAHQIFNQKKVENYPIPFENIISILIFVIQNKYSKLIFMEQEIWPAFLVINKIFGRKLILVNCNMYEKSFSTQKKLKFFFGNLFSMFYEILPKSKEDAIKLKKIKEELNIKELGNFKILSTLKNFNLLNSKISIQDSNNKENIEKKDNNIKDLKYKTNCKIILFSSFHPQEFDIVSRTILRLKEFKKLKFIIAPRHIDKINLLEKELKNNNISYDLMSSHFSDIEINENSFEIILNKLVNLILKILDDEYNKDILIIDKFGFLSYIYKYSFISIIGGSFNNKGGQNFIEPIIQGVPVIIGPSYENFKDMIEEFSGEWLKIIDNYENEMDLIYKMTEAIYQFLDDNNKNILDKLQIKILQLKKIAEKQNEYILNLLKFSD